MPTIAWWNNHRFEISPSVIRGFTGLTVKGSCETTDKTAGQEKYLTFKNTQPAEISLTAHLNAFLGCDVRREAIDFVIEARWGKSDYFYVYENNQYAKIFVIKMMLTSATVKNVQMAPTGKWVSCDVDLTMKACKVSDNNSINSSSGGSGGGGNSGYSKASVKSTSAASNTKDMYVGLRAALGNSNSASTQSRAGASAGVLSNANKNITAAKKQATTATKQKQSNTAKKSTTTHSALASVLKGNGGR